MNKILAAVLNVFLVTSAFAVSGLRQKPAAQEQVPIKAVAPVYPLIALAAGVGGSVTVEARVDRQGKVISVRATEGPKLLRDAAEKAADRWVFSASDKSVETRTVRMTFVFQLMPDDTLSQELVPIFIPPYRIEVRETKPNLIQRVDSDPPMTKRKRVAP